MNWTEAIETSALVAAIENSGIAVWVRESPSILAYTTVLALHAMGLAMIVGLNIVIALRLLGKVPELPLPHLRKLYPWMYAGFTINAVSGLGLLAASLSTNLVKPFFLAKLGFVFLGMINLELLRMRVFTDTAGTASSGLPRGARAFGIASLVIWGLAIISGRLTSYPYFTEAWFGF